MLFRSIIGVGNIGKAVTRRARAFGMKVYGTDIVDIDHVFVSESGIQMVGLKDLIVNADFISINCDLNPSSHHLIDRETLSWAKPNAVVINTARGPIIHEEALVEALQKGKIAGAALDVFEVEPLVAPIHFWQRLENMNSASGVVVAGNCFDCV